MGILDNGLHDDDGAASSQMDIEPWPLREWSYADWFKQIRNSAREQGVESLTVPSLISR